MTCLLRHEPELNTLLLAAKSSPKCLLSTACLMFRVLFRKMFVIVMRLIDDIIFSQVDLKFLTLFHPLKFTKRIFFSVGKCWPRVWSWDGGLQ